MGVFQSGHKVWAAIRVQNNGDTEAVRVSMAARLAFLPAAPTDYPNDFELLQDSTVAPYDKE
jgi:hypothetical protein